MTMIERYRQRHARRIRAAALVGLGALLLYGSTTSVSAPVAASDKTTATPVSLAKLATLIRADAPVRANRSQIRKPIKHLAAPAPQQPPTMDPPASSQSIPAVWARVAACESGGNWHDNTGNGYYGGVQEDLTFWLDYGGRAFAARPDLASPSQQIIVARRGLAVQGPSAWPVCGPRAGLQRGD